MNKPYRKSNQQKPKRDPLQASSQIDSSSEVGPKLDTNSPEKTANESDNEKETTLKNDWHRPLGIPITEWLVAFFTLVIMGSSIVYTVYAKKQWRVMRESNRINHEALTSVQRAFVTYQTAKMQRMKRNLAKNAPHYWEISAIIENSGTTPAISVITSFQAKSGLSVEPNEELFKGNGKDMSPPGTVGSKVLEDVGPISTPEAAIFGRDFADNFSNVTITNFDPRTFLWGWIVYKDVFHDTAPHLTEYCRQIGQVSVIRDLSHPDPQVTFNWHACRDHNCTEHDLPPGK